MTDLTTWQIEAIRHAAEEADQYMANGHDPETWSDDDEWMCFVEVVCLAFEQKMKEMQNGVTPPF